MTSTHPANASVPGGTFGIKDRPGVIPSATIRVYFEQGVNDTAALKNRIPLDSVTRDGITEYADANTQTMWVGFALGMRCAERIAAQPEDGAA